jgi:arsenite methyltransferase
VTADAVFWNNLADKYSKKPVADPAAFERKIAITKALISPRDVVVDVGCGTGSLALRLAPGAAHVHGLDLSSEMIRIARDKTKAAEVTEQTVDGICAYSLLHLTDDLPATLGRILRLLEPGGFFVSSTPCLGGPWSPYRPLLWTMRALNKAPAVKIFTKRTLEDEMRRAGFADITQPDIGVKPDIAFIVAKRPA